jgi:hypothetical protein
VACPEYLPDVVEVGAGEVRAFGSGEEQREGDRLSVRVRELLVAGTREQQVSPVLRQLSERPAGLCRRPRLDRQCRGHLIAKQAAQPGDRVGEPLGRAWRARRPQEEVRNERPECLHVDAQRVARRPNIALAGDHLPDRFAEAVDRPVVAVGVGKVR